MKFDRLIINREIFFIGSLFLILWIYLLLRVIQVPFLDDEINTWFIYVMHSKVMPLSGYVDANNHILNSALAWISSQLFGTSPAILRLPNFLFFPVYFYYSYKISLLINSRFVRFAVFLGLVMAHHLFDFFGLCRGYGIAMGLLMVACFHMVQYLTDHKFKPLVIALICSFFMVWANLSLLGTAYIFFALLALNILMQKTTNKHKTWLLLFLFICFALILGYATWYSLYLQKIGKLYLGKNEGGFIEVTALSLINILFRTKSMILFIIAAFLSVLIAVSSVIHFLKNNFRNYLDNPLHLFTYVFFGNILLIFFSHWFLGVVYPQERATLYLFPMLIVAAGFSVVYLKKIFDKRIFATIAAPFLLIPVHFIASANIDYASAYRWESYPDRYLRYIEKNSSLSNIYPIVGIFDEDRWIYDNFRYNGNIPFVSENKYPDTVADFQIGKFPNNAYWKSLYDSLDHDSRNDLVLLQRKAFLKRVRVLKYENITTKGITNAEYFGFTPEDRNDSLTGTHFLYYFDFVVSSPQPAFEGFVIASVHNTKIYERLRLDRIAEHWDKRRIKAGILIRETDDILKIPLAYFWNKEKVPFSIEEGSLTIYKIGNN